MLKINSKYASDVVYLTEDLQNHAMTAIIQDPAEWVDDIEKLYNCEIIRWTEKTLLDCYGDDIPNIYSNKIKKTGYCLEINCGNIQEISELDTLNVNWHVIADLAISLINQAQDEVRLYSFDPQEALDVVLCQEGSIRYRNAIMKLFLNPDLIED